MFREENLRHRITFTISPLAANSTHLKTQDFLQPLERGGKNSNTKGLEVSSAETSAATPASSVEHVLPGGIGTYTISHISGYSQMNGKSEIPVVHVNVAETKPEVTRAASSTNYGGGAFTLWEERIRVVDGNRTSDGLATSDFSKGNFLFQLLSFFYKAF